MKKQLKKSYYKDISAWLSLILAAHHCSSDINKIAIETKSFIDVLVK